MPFVFSRWSRRRAFTLVELLVVIAIIGVLVALLLPAVQAAREAARRTQCSNNLHQLAIGLHNYHDANKTFPAAAYCGVTGTNPIANCHTWVESLFPYIEQQALFDQIDFRVSNRHPPNPAALNDRLIGVLMCPSDPDSGLRPNNRERAYTPIPLGEDQATSQTRSLGANYIPCAGPLHMNLCPIPAMSPNINCKGSGGARLDNDSPGIFTGGRRAYNISNCRDGTSNTFMIGETLPIYNTFHMYFASHMHIASVNPPPNYHKVRPDCPKSDTRIGTCYAIMSGYKSAHPGVVNVAMVDGSVRSVSETINYVTWVTLGDRASGRAVGDY